jgi:hypothetical protein
MAPGLGVMPVPKGGQKEVLPISMGVNIRGFPKKPF